MITVYTAPSCMQCKFTFKALTEAGLDFAAVDVSADTDAHDYVTRVLGYRQVPVVVVDADTHWAGYRFERIETLAQAVTA